MTLKPTSPGIVQNFPLGMSWLDSGDTLDADPTTSYISHTGITVDNVSRPASSVNITVGSATWSFAQNEWIQFDITIAANVRGNQYIEFNCTSTNGERHIAKLPMEVLRSSAGGVASANGATSTTFPTSEHAALEAGNHDGTDPGDGNQLDLNDKSSVIWKITPAAADETRQIPAIASEPDGVTFIVSNLSATYPFDLVDSDSETILTIAPNSSVDLIISETSGGNVLRLIGSQSALTQAV